MIKKSSTKSKANTGKKTVKKATYLREIQIKFKKKPLKAGATVGKQAADAKQVVELFSDLQDETKEKLIAISLDAKLKIIAFEIVAIGSVDSVYIRPAEAIRASIMVNASSFIILHNHPSGDPNPSVADQKFTDKLQIATNALGLEFNDHIIVGDDSYYSFAEQGLM